MENVYLEFYNHQTRKIHQDDLKGIELEKYPYLVFDAPY